MLHKDAPERLAQAQAAVGQDLFLHQADLCSRVPTCKIQGVEGTPDLLAHSLVTICQKRGHDVFVPNTISESRHCSSHSTISFNQHTSTVNRATSFIPKIQLRMHNVSNGLSTTKARELHGVYDFN